MNIRSTVAAAFLTMLLTSPSFGRVLDAELGRWTRRDPLRQADGLNVYSYVADNPVSFGDPTGLVHCQSGIVICIRAYFSPTYKCFFFGCAVSGVVQGEIPGCWLLCYLGCEAFNPWHNFKPSGTVEAGLARALEPLGEKRR